MPSIEVLEALAKRRGFFWLSSDLYGGFAGFYDYGPMGTALKRKLENQWRWFFLGLHPNFFEIDPREVMAENVFKASGHVESFVDPIAKCKKCGTHHRADHIMEDFLKESFEGMTPEKLKEIIRKHKIKCPKCKGELGNISVFNMMFKVPVGPLGEAGGYLRPETAQGAYINFLQSFEVLRKKLPLGLAIVGRAFRNEISPRQLTSRMREFDQAELQIFFDPDNLDKHDDWDSVKKNKLVLKPVDKKASEMTCEDANKKMKIPKFYVYYMSKVQDFFLNTLNFPRKKFRFRELSKEERAFYNKIHWDIELDVEALGGFKEIGGVHYRTDHDLSGHQKVSKKKQQVFFNGKKFIPHVLELSFGVDRMMLALLDIHYNKKKDRVFISLPFSLSPFTVAVFPLVSKNGLPEKAMEIYNSLKGTFDCIYDDSGSIGKRYYRQDEIGTSFCITIDHQTLEDSTVTIRLRDSTKQERVKIDSLHDFICDKLK
ncbi:MAG: glycine--tRNA ligase [Candidatus Aenigmatarchaeota archaeon]